MLSVLLRYTDSNYPFDILKLFLLRTYAISTYITTYVVSSNLDQDEVYRIE